ncbi:MAG TPA: shikimate kinase [Acetivibrio sp.]|jgi:shikimate kinase|nr:shikimate kinase [Acetivibrio sp.]HQA58001.1 shikimate kinase [Acetivibrio sp.]
MMKTNSIVLIGMPGSGKTTVGQPLSEALGMSFVDTDKIIFEKVNKPLKDIVAQDGLEKFLEIQEQILLGLDLNNRVISTGGSVVYNKAAMEFLKKNGIVFYLKEDLEILEKRLASGRRLARNSEQSFADIYAERAPLYEKYADVTIDCSNKSVQSIVTEITSIYNEFKAKS